MTAYLREMIHAAKDYCLLIENVDIYRTESWLADLSRILARIQAAMVHLDDPNLECSFFALPDLEQRFELYCCLKDKLGDRDSYWLESDASSEIEDMTGSLAGDLADIYFEIKRGLNLLEEKQATVGDALKIWQAGYLIHWGQHLVDALRHLHALRVTTHFAQTN